MKLLKHLTGYMPVSLANGLVGFGSVYAFTRLLGGEDFGRYAVLFSSMALVHTLTLTWAEAASYRFAGQAVQTKDLPGHYRTALVFVFRSLLLSAVGIGLLAVFFRHEPAYLKTLPWLLAVMAVNTFGQVALEAHRAHQRVKRYAVSEVLRILVGFTVGVGIAFLTGFGAAAPFIGLLFGGMAMLLREGPWLVDQARGGELGPERSKAWIMFGVPVAAAMVLDILLSVSDRFLIKYYLGEYAVGAYAAGYGIADKPVLMICAWAALGASPLMMAAFEEDGKAAAETAAGDLFKMILFLGLPAAVGLGLVAEPLAQAAVSEDLRVQAAKIIPLIAFSGLLNGLLIHYVSESFQLVRRTDQRALLMIVPVIANLILNIVLIPKVGLMGAVYATVISYGLAVLLLGAVGRRLLCLPVPMHEVFKVGFAALCMWPVIHILPDLGSWLELFMKVILGGAVYILVAVLLDAGGARGLITAWLKRKGVEDV